MPTDFDVAVIGAGAAGLMAARELSRAGKRVVILEARDRIGGRIYPLSENEFGYPAQGGAEFVHGEAPLSKALLAEAGATLEHGGEWWNVFSGTPRRSDFAPHSPLLETRLRALEVDMSIAQFFEQNFPESEHAAMRDQIFLRTEGYDAADPKRASAFGLRAELLDESGWMQSSIKEGYGILVRKLERDCNDNRVQMHLSEPVTAIECSADYIIITGVRGDTFNVTHVIVTVSLPTLKEIRFNPPIPEKLVAAERIGFGPVIKMILQFSSRWWAANGRPFENMFFMFSHEQIPTWWTQYPQPRATLTGWLAGPSARALSGTPESKLIELGLASLSRIFAIEIGSLQSELVNAQAIDWAADPYARGAYSYVTPESASAIATILEPVEDRIFFAGEGVYQGDSVGTVEAALVSGKSAADAVLKALH